MARAPAKPPAPAPAAGAHPVRQVVVVRQGPPPAKRGWADVVAGVIGLLLVVASVGLAYSLPDQTVLPPQYKVTFTDLHADLERQEKNFNLTSEASRVQDFEFEVTADNVYLVQVNVYFTDDLAASDPDKFSVELYAPDGNPVAALAILQNDAPQRNATFPTQFDAIQKTYTFSYPLTSKPQDTVVEGDLNSTAESIAAAQEYENHFGTKGTWRLRVALLALGGCPAPTPGNPSSDDAVRGAACIQANSGRGGDAQKDPGNSFTVGSFSYDHFGVVAERLD